MFRSENEARKFHSSISVAWLLLLLIALTAGILSGALAALVGWRFLDDTRPFVTFGITMLSIALLVWARLTWIALGKIDMSTGKPSRTFIIKIEENSGRTLKLVEMESANDQEMENICKMVVNGGTLSIRRLKVYLSTDTRVEAFRLELVAKGLAVFDEQQECKLTRTGGSVFRGIAHYPTEGECDA